MTLEELKERQGWSLQHKIDHSLFTIETFLTRSKEIGNGAYVAFSGGKDSTCLLDLVRIIDKDVPAVFVNTGNEYPDIIKFVRHLRDDKGYNIVEIHPKMKPRDIWAKYGFPLISKEMAETIHRYRVNPIKAEERCQSKLEKGWTFGLIPEKWKYLTQEPYETSNVCCTYLKKNPSHKYGKETGRFKIVGTMASESALRQSDYLRRGSCNTFGENGDRIKSTPLAIWTDDDIWAYIKERNLEIADIYHKGAQRTGCVGCGFGCQFKDDTRFALLYKNYPKYYDMVMNYTNNGVTFREAVRKVLAVNHLELPDESGELFLLPDYD